MSDRPIVYAWGWSGSRPPEPPTGEPKFASRDAVLAAAAEIAERDADLLRRLGSEWAQ